MGREIKFRAWDKDDEKMWKVVAMSESIWGDCEEKHIGVCDFDKNPMYKETDVRLSVNYELMQYTELKDKNGREIYEKDIVFCQSGFHKYKTVVRIGEYSQDGSDNEYESITCCGVYGEESRDSHGRYVPASSINDNESVEVIGNIFENPELLEGMQ